MDNVDCDIDVDFKKYADKHIKIVSHKQSFNLFCITVD